MPSVMPNNQNDQHGTGVISDVSSAGVITILAMAIFVQLPNGHRDTAWQISLSQVNMKIY